LYGTDVRCPISRGEFYNRIKELEAFRGVLEDLPQISVVSGPVNSGKTTLMLLLLEEMSKNKQNPRPVLHIDLRGGSFWTVHELANALEGAMASWVDRFRDIVQKTNQASVGDFTFKRDLEEVTPIERLNKTFTVMSKLLPQYNLLFGK